MGIPFFCQLQAFEAEVIVLSNMLVLMVDIGAVLITLWIG